MSLETLLPPMIPMVGGCLFLLAGLLIGSSRWWGPMAALVLSVAAWSLSGATPTPVGFEPDTVHRPVALDGFGLAVEWSALTAGFFFAFVALKRQEQEPFAGGFFGLMLLSVSGVMLAGVANDLVVLFVVVVLAIVPIAVLMLLTAETAEGRIAGRNFLLLGCLASALLLLGFSLIYGLAGTSNLTEILLVLTRSYPADPSAAESAVGSRLGVAGLVLTFVAASMWLPAAPFHFGTPEILETTTPWLAGFTSVVSKLVGTLIIIRISLVLSAGFSEAGMLVVTVVAGATMILPAVMMMFQSNLRSTLSYAVVGQGGFVLMGLAVAFSQEGLAGAASDDTELTSGLTAALFQFAVSVISLAVVFSVLTYLRRRDRRTEFVDDLKGLLRTEPAAAACLLVAFCSMIGVPPFPGFWSRLLLFLATLSVQTGAGDSTMPDTHTAFVVLALLAGLSILLTSTALLRLIAAICFDVPLGRSNPSGGRGALVAAMCASVLLLIAGIFPGMCVKVVEQIRLF